MNKKQIRQEDNKSLKKVIFFLGIVFILIFLSFTVKIYYLIKYSSYDGNNRFTLAINERSDKAIILSFNPQNKTISRLTLSGKRNNKSAGKIVGIPIDGMVVNAGENNLTGKSQENILLYLLTKRGFNKKNFTSFDILRLIFFSKTVNPADYLEDAAVTSEDTLTLDKKVVRLFADQVILDEQKSIEIVNGTGINGLGKRLERIIKNSGGNVVAVSNTHEIAQKSKIYYYQEQSYTLVKFQKMLNYPLAIMTKREIADIQIVIGVNGLREEVF